MREETAKKKLWGPRKGEPNTGGGESEGPSPVWQRDLQETCGLRAQAVAHGNTPEEAAGHFVTGPQIRNQQKMEAVLFGFFFLF